MPVRLIARCVRGLEWVLAAEVDLYGNADYGSADGPADSADSTVDGTVDGTVDDIRLSERQVSFEVPRLRAALLDLRTADDLLLDVGTLRGIDHTRAALPELARRLTRIDFDAALTRLGDVRTLPRGMTFDVVASLLGRRNYNRYAVEDAAGQVVADAVGAQYVSRNPDSGDRPRGASDSRNTSSRYTKGAAKTPDTAGTDFTVRLSLSGDTVDVALRVPRKPLHRRPWKLDTGPGTLHPPLAAALVQIAGEGGGGGSLLDPFCGDGTIAIEAAIAFPDARILAVDLDAERLRNARSNALRAAMSEHVRFIEADAGSGIWRSGIWGSDARGSEAQGSNTRGSGTQGSDTRGSGTRGSKARGGEAQGSKARGGEAQGSEPGGNVARGSEARGSETWESETWGGEARGREAQGSDGSVSLTSVADFTGFADFAGFDAIVTNPPWNRAVGAAGALADTLDPFWRRVPGHLTSHGRICTIAEADLDIPARLRDMGYSVALAQTIRLAGRVSHVVLATPPGAAEVRLPSVLDLWHERAIKAGIVAPDGF